MKLRHITNKNFLKSIVESGCLDSKFNQREHDRGYISFELNPQNDFLTRHFHIIKDWNKMDTIELIFDGERLIKDKYEIVDNIEGVKFNKEIDVGWLLKQNNVSFNNEDLNDIGDYWKVPLTYLTVESRGELSELIKNMNLSKF